MTASKDTVLFISCANVASSQGGPLPSSYTYMPMGAMYLAGALRERFGASILDLNLLGLWKLPPDEARARAAEAVRAEIREAKPLLAGLSCLFSTQMEQVLELARVIKDESPETKVAVGGIHPTIYSRDVIENCPDLDFVMQGEGEESVPALALALRGEGNLAGIDGLTRRGPDGRAVESPKTRYIEDVDSIPRPAYELIDFSAYRPDTADWHNPKGHDIGTPAPLLTSRSCPGRCNFCSLHRAMGPKFRRHSAERVLDEMEYLYHEKKVRYFEVLDDNLTVDKKRILDICRGVRTRGLDVQMRVGGMAINALDAEIIEALTGAGLVWGSLAIESGSEFIRNQIMGKNLSTAKIREVVKLFRKYPDVITTALFIIGMPEDTHETLQMTYDLIEELELDQVYISHLLPIPGTRVYDQCLAEGLMLNPAEHAWNSGTVRNFYRNANIFVKPRALETEELALWAERFEALREAKKSLKFRRLGAGSIIDPDQKNTPRKNYA
ncbi:hypothetical protein C4J81_18655 (plasmid) [Deltaproteobacteria bacterium Smac51]|nr:hypothetical protein C4J81_18655 [Deltaproteobacteria bacterium Smac51]